MFAKLAILLLAGCSCFGQTSLTKYLSLSPAQVTTISKLMSEYQNYALSQNAQGLQLSTQLSNNLQAPSPDPVAVGNIVADKEYRRRDAVAKQAEVLKNIAAQLSGPQAALIQGLVQAAELLPLAQEASCAHLAQLATSAWFDSSTFLPITGGLYSYDPAVTFPLLPPTPTANFCNSVVFPVSIRDYLSLSDSQIALIVQASAAYNDFHARSLNRLADLDVQIQISLTAANTDALALGLLYVEKDKINAELASRNTSLISTAQAQLTPQQQTRLLPLQEAVNLNNANLIYSAVNCNFVLLPPGSSSYGTALTGNPNFCSL